ncbi:MAG: hypothetical protein HY560_07900 [Gemmatimonadetes bacterium]|nr:hypothetical protein [Gemmatimonadota bacterium]
MKRMTLLSLLLVLGPTTLAAQQTLDSRWFPWLGCWQAGEEAGPDNLMVCVRPSADQSGVEIATVANGEIASSRTLVADGQPHELTVEDCSGSQFATFSSDSRRVYLWSTLVCREGRKRTASAIMALGSPTVWLDVQALGTNGERVPRVLRHRPAPGSSWPAEFLLPVARVAAVDDARLLASGRLSLADVQEAAAHVDPEALAAFLIEKNQEFDLTAAQLAALADAGVPEDVIDALVAVSYPTRFAIDRDALRMALKPDEPREGRAGAYGDPFGWGWGYGSCYRGFYGGFPFWSSYCSPFYWSSAFGFGGMWPYYYDPYWYGGGYWGRPIIVVRDGNQAAPGTLVRGRGYTRGGRPLGEPGGGYARPRSGTTQDRAGGGSYSPSVRSGSSSSGGSGSASPGGYSRGGSSSSSGSSSGTAKPKCCN